MSGLSFQSLKSELELYDSFHITGLWGAQPQNTKSIALTSGSTFSLQKQNKEVKKKGGSF